MKIRTCAALLIAAMMLILTGCGLRTVEDRLDAAEEVVEIHLDAAEEAIEASVREAVLPDPKPEPRPEAKPEPLPQESVTLAANASSAVTEPTVPAEEPQAVETLPSAPSVHAAALSKEEAETIALKHAGFTKDQVSYLRAEYDRDDRVPEYDVEFHNGRWEYEYEIHADTGAILSFDKDD